MAQLGGLIWLNQIQGILWDSEDRCFDLTQHLIIALKSIFKVECHQESLYENIPFIRAMAELCLQVPIHRYYIQGVIE